MGRRLALILAALCASSLTLAGEPRPPLELSPSGTWNLHYADESCRLLRSFGEGEQATVFYVERFVPMTGFKAMVAGKPLTDLAHPDATLAFSSGAETATPILGKVDVFGPSLLFSHASLNAADNEDLRNLVEGKQSEHEQSENVLKPQEEATVTWAEVRRGDKAVRLKLGPMDKPMAALRTCTDKLIEHWGVDPEAQRQLKRKLEPATPPEKWIRSGDYPTGLLNRGVQGVVQFRLVVDAEGKPTGCGVQQSTRPAQFDEAVCRLLMRRAQFIPALDAQGRPVASYWRSSVRFTID